MKLGAIDTFSQYNNGNRKILNNVSIGLESGEHVGLIAPSGSGKAIFYKILAGYEKPDHGTVVLDGKNIFSCTGYSLVQMIWQHPELSVNPRLKIREVLREGGFVEEWVVHDLGIEPDWLDQYLGELSGGGLQRFCIARVLGKRIRLIPADEISTMLNLIIQSQIQGFLLEEVKTRDLGLLVVSHSGELLGCVCGRVVDSRTDQGRSGRVIRMWKDWERDGQAVWVWERRTKDGCQRITRADEARWC